MGHDHHRRHHPRVEGDPALDDPISRALEAVQACIERCNGQLQPPDSPGPDGTRSAELIEGGRTGVHWGGDWDGKPGGDLGLRLSDGTRATGIEGAARPRRGGAATRDRVAVTPPHRVVTGAKPPMGPTDWLSVLRGARKAHGRHP